MIEDLEDDFREIFRTDLITQAVIILALDFGPHDRVLREVPSRAYRKVINPNKALLVSQTFVMRIDSGGAFHLSASHRLKLARLLGIETKRLGIAFTTRAADGFARHLVASRPVVLRASDAPFSKPSGRTSSYFIHAANAVAESRDVEFMALFALRHITAHVTRIYLDTVVISPLIYAALLLRNCLRPSVRQTFPIVRSYHSYEGLRNGFQLQTTLSRVFISASTSGGMRDELISRFNFPPHCIATVFGPPDAAVAPMFGLPVDPQSAPPARHATRLLLGGEMFWPEAQPPAIFRISLADRPAWLNRFGEAFFNTGAVRCHFSSPTYGSNKDAVYLAVEKAWDAKLFRKAVHDFLIQVLPLKVGVIIASDDDASEKIARYIANRFYRTTRPKVVREVELTKRDPAQPAELKVRDVALVIASVVASGRSFLNISQSLRNIDGLAGITYLSLINRFSSPSREAYVRSNLLQGRRAGEYLWHAWQTIQLPDCSDIEALSFEKEARFLRAIELPGPFWKKRLKDIDAATTTKCSGFGGTCFLPTFRGQPLKLRNNFALYNSNKLTQPEVFAVTVAYLSSARRKVGETDSTSVLVGGTLLDPAVFTRFNDGVLHASLLRACHPSELDYSTRRTESADMRNLLLSFIRSARQNSGEAAGEFILALAMRRLRLWADDYVILRESFELEHAAWPPHYTTIWQHFVSSLKPIKSLES